MKQHKHLPPKRVRKPKQIKVRIATGPKFSRILTYHIYGRRPKRGERVRIKAGLYKGRLCTVHRRFSPFYRGYTKLAEVAYPKEWT